MIANNTCFVPQEIFGWILVNELTEVLFISWVDSCFNHELSLSYNKVLSHSLFGLCKHSASIGDNQWVQFFSTWRNAMTHLCFHAHCHFPHWCLAAICNKKFLKIRWEALWYVVISLTYTTDTVVLYNALGGITCAAFATSRNFFIPGENELLKSMIIETTVLCSWKLALSNGFIMLSVSVTVSSSQNWVNTFISELSKFPATIHDFFNHHHWLYIYICSESNTSYLFPQK